VQKIDHYRLLIHQCSVFFLVSRISEIRALLEVFFLAENGQFVGGPKRRSFWSILGQKKITYNSHPFFNMAFVMFFKKSFFALLFPMKKVDKSWFFLLFIGFFEKTRIYDLLFFSEHTAALIESYIFRVFFFLLYRWKVTSTLTWDL